MNLFRMPLAYMTLAYCMATVGSAVQASPLSDAAAEYQHAVKQFEIEIYERGYDRQSKRIVQDLEEAAIRMRSPSHQPHRLDRLQAAWQEIQLLHPHVEAAFFAPNRTCSLRPDIGLSQSWQRVNCAFDDLAQAVACACNLHGHTSVVPGGHSLPLPSAPGFPYGAVPPLEHFQTHPPQYYLPNGGRSSGRLEIPPAIPGSHLPQNAPHSLYGSPLQPTIEATPYDRPDYFGQGARSADAPSVLVDIILRRLASRLGN